MSKLSIGEKATIIFLLIAMGIFGVLGYEGTINEHDYQCTITYRSPANFFGSRTFDVSCDNNGPVLTNLPAYLGSNCAARVGDTVIVATYGGWYESSIKSDWQC